MANLKQAAVAATKKIKVQDDAPLQDTPKTEEKKPNVDAQDGTSSEDTKKMQAQDDAPEGRKNPTEEMIKRDYAPYYPDNHEWYVTSDNTVFLSSSKQHAFAHQRTINASKGVVKEILTIKIK